MKYPKIVINGIRMIFLIGCVIETFKGDIKDLVILLAGLGLTYIPNLYTKWTKVMIPLGAYMVYSLFIFAAQFLGSYLGAYGYLSWWDKMLHLSSGILVGYSGLVLLINLDPEQILFRRKKIGVIVLVVFMTATAGAVFWEMIEFLGDTFLGTNAQLGSLQDTMEDLICGTIVGAGFALYVGIVLKKQCKSCIDSLLRINNRQLKHK